MTTRRRYPDIPPERLRSRGRRAGRSVAAIGVALAFSVLIAGASTGWLAYQRHEKCDRTVARKLCESPVDWIRSR